MNLDRRPLRLLVAALLLAGLTATTIPAVAAPAPERSVSAANRQATATARTFDHPRAGIVYHALWGTHTNAERRQMFDKLKRMHIRWVRIGLPWALVQPRKPTATDKGWSAWGLDRVDKVVRMAHKRNISVSLTFLGTPGWANGGKGPKYLPNNPADYARAIRKMAKRYRGKVTSFEIYNEVSGGIRLKGATIQDYKKVLCAAHAAVRKGSPRAKVLSAGTGRDAVAWVGDLYDAGAKPCFDVLAIHPYYGDHGPTWPAGKTPGWLRKTKEMRAIMRKHKDLGTPVWFTEFGWHTGSMANGVTPQQQAKYTVQMFKVTDKRLPYVQKMSPYMAQDEDAEAASNAHYGFYTLDMKPKPVVSALRTYLGQLS
ncbi:glycoside hydrolase family 5 protein [Nocardioides sp.]|uniref:glycoside hydrolase family 5 protein n=1 Tax=Nocardioides sp. TaxID=35761 RepID=UPI003529B9AB